MAIQSSHAGHGGKKTGGKWTDSGAVGSGHQEATLAREINDKIIKYTKTKDSTDNSGTNSNAILANTSANIRKAGGGWHISNHLNAFNGSAHGVEVLYGADSDKYMAERVAKAISNATGLTNRGAKDGKWLYIANNSGINDKVLLIEWCFIDNKSDVDKLQKNMDKAIQAMLKCFDYDVKIEGATTSKPNPKPNPKPTNNALPKGFTAEKAKFTVTANDGIQVRKGSYGLNAPKAGILKKGESINYDGWAVKDGYTWVHYKGYSGDDLFLPVRPVGKKAWGTFK